MLLMNKAGRPCTAHSTTACVDMLLDAGADLEARDGEGRTPIYCIAICKDNRTDVIRRLAEVVLRMADCGTDLVNAGGEPGLLMRRVEALRAERSRGQGGDGGSGEHK